MVRSKWKTAQACSILTGNNTTPQFNQVKCHINQSPFGLLLTFPWRQNDLSMIRALTEWWMASTYTFYFLWGELALTPLGFYMLNGLPLLQGMHLEFNKDIETKARKELLFPID